MVSNTHEVPQPDSGTAFLGTQFLDVNKKEVGREAVEGYKLIMIVYTAKW